MSGVEYVTLSVGILCGDKLVCLIHSHVAVVAYQHSFQRLVFARLGYLHAQKDLGKLVYILASSILEKMLKRVVRDDEMGLFFPHTSKLGRGIRFP